MSWNLLHSLIQAVLDFEAATWNSLRNVFPDIAIYGCIFHFVRGVYKKLQSLGLSVPYKRDQVTRNLIKQIYCLPFLPVRDMLVEFAGLEEEFVSNGDQMTELYSYVQRTWFGSSVWKPRDISVYRRLIRTNNDAEGYHKRLNGNWVMKTHQFTHLSKCCTKKPCL